MKLSTRQLPGHAFLVWTDLAWKFGEMWLASAEVVTHRGVRMAAAGPMPSSRDREEFTRMGQEKFEAATESAGAIGAHLFAMNLKFGARTFRQWMTGSAALMAMATSRDVGQSMNSHARLAKSMTLSALTASEFANSTAQLALKGLNPIHARATANAKRLGRR